MGRRPPPTTCPAIYAKRKTNNGPSQSSPEELIIGEKLHHWFGPCRFEIRSRRRNHRNREKRGRKNGNRVR